MKHSEKKISNDIEVLAEFIYTFCRVNHKDAYKAHPAIQGTAGEYLKDFSKELCEECTRLLAHGTAMRIICPHDPKPRCKKCETHCYKPGYREEIRKVMAFSGKYLIRHGRIDLLWKYFF